MLYMSIMETKPHSDPRICGSERISLRQVANSLIWLAATTAVYVAAAKLLRGHPDWSPGWRVAATLMPVVPGIFYLLSLLRSFRAMDELQKRIQLEAWVFALAGTVVVTTVLNVLNANGMALANYPHGFQVGGVYMTMYLFWSVGFAVSRLRYR